MVATPSPAKKPDFRKMDSDMQAQHLQLRAKEIVTRKLRSQIVAVMHKHPETLGDIKNCLENLGYKLGGAAGKRGVSQGSGSNVASTKPEEDEDMDDEAEEEPDKSALAETGGTGSGEVGGDSRLRCGVINDPDSSHWAPHRYTRFDNSSVPFIAGLLAEIEPISMSLVALRTVTGKGKQEVKLTSLLQLLEYSTGVSRETPLVGERRHLPSLLAWLRSQSAGEGRRARELQVLAQWGGAAENDGVYQLHSGEGDDEGAVFVMDRVTRASHVIPDDARLRTADGQMIEIAELNIDFNWSAERARVMSDLTTMSLLILPLGTWGRHGKRLALMQVAAASLAEAPVSRSSAMVAKQEEVEPPKKVAKQSDGQDAPSTRNIRIMKKSPDLDFTPPPPPPQAASFKNLASAGAAASFVPQPSVPKSEDIGKGRGSRPASVKLAQLVT